MGMVSDGMLLSRCFFLRHPGNGLGFCWFLLVTVGFCGQVMTLGLVICGVPCLFVVILAGMTSIIHYSVYLLLLRDVPPATSI